jgi:hypothetical protein
MPSPSGTRLTDAFPTLITLLNAPSAPLWEVNVTPSGWDAGGPNDTTTMRNVRYRTRQPKKLITATPVSFTAQFDPAYKTSLVAQVGVLQQIEVKHPDNSKDSVWGWLDKINEGARREGEPPTVTVTLENSNQDTSGAEQAPVHTPPL